MTTQRIIKTTRILGWGVVLVFLFLSTDAEHRPFFLFLLGGTVIGLWYDQPLVGFAFGLVAYGLIYYTSLYLGFIPIGPGI